MGLVIPLPSGWAELERADYTAKCPAWGCVGVGQR
jgi:hypothetical protein